MFRRSVVIYEKALGPEHPFVGAALMNLAGLAYVQSDWAGAADSSTSIIKRRAARRLTGGRGETSGGEAQRSALWFSALVKTTHRLVAEGRNRTTELPAEMFETAQWAQGSDIATSLAQMAARSSRGSPTDQALALGRQPSRVFSIRGRKGRGSGEVCALEPIGQARV